MTYGAAPDYGHVADAVHSSPDTTFAGRALIVAWAFPPASPIGTFRTLRFATQLAASGWTATVLSAAPHTYPEGTPTDPALVARIPPAIDVLHVPVFRPSVMLGTALSKPPRTRAASPRPSPSGPGRPPSVWRRCRAFVREVTTIPDKEIGWVLPATVAGVLAHWRRPVDVLYSSSSPWSGQLAALTIARVTGVPWVADFRDPWARAPWREAWSERVRLAAGTLERRVVARADAILFATRANRDEYAAFYGADAARKFHVVPNGCDPGEFVSLRSEGDSAQFVLLHAGSLYGARTPVPLFRAMAAAIRRGTLDPRKFRLRLLGTTPDAGRAFMAAAATLGVDELVEFVPRLPREATLEQMASASCLLVLQPGTTVSVPGKVYEYLAVGRPILAIAEEGETADLVRASGVGSSVGPDDEVAIDAAFERILTQGQTRGRMRVPTHLYDGNVAAREAVAVVGRIAQAARKRRVHGTR